VLDPRPSVREGWQRRMIIRSIRRRGRLTRTETLLRTERSSLSKSHFFKTSVKKLMMLARQIAGKDLDEAMLQMRFSKKKAAREVLAHLKHAKN
jgi:ribosomal protein L22